MQYSLYGHSFWLLRQKTVGASILPTKGWSFMLLWKLGNSTVIKLKMSLGKYTSSPLKMQLVTQLKSTGNKVGQVELRTQ